MAGYRFRADNIPGIFLEHDAGDVVIAAIRDDGNDLDLVFASEEIPQLVLLLADAFSTLSTGSEAHRPQTSLLLDGAEILGRSPNLTLLATLSSGLPVAFSLSDEVALALRDQLNARLPAG